jgi:uncharacterized membrane protein YbhN (UPF0104 family)
MLYYLKRLGSIVFLLIFFGWTAWYIHSHADKFAFSISQIPIPNLLGLYGLTLGVMVCNGLFIKYALRSYAIELGCRDWLSISIVTSVMNYVMPFRGGAGFRALYLKVQYNFAIIDFLSTLSGMFLIHFVVNGCLGLVGMSLLWYEGALFNPLLAVFFSAVALGAGMAICLPFPTDRWSQTHPVVTKLIQIKRGWHMLRQDVAIYVPLWIVMIGCAGLSAGQFKLLFNAFNVELSWGGILFYTAGQNLAALATLTPGALGIMETLGFYMATHLAVSTDEALLVQGLFRFVLLTTLFSTLPLALVWLRPFFMRRLQLQKAALEQDGGPHEDAHFN